MVNASSVRSSAIHWMPIQRRSCQLQGTCVAIQRGSAGAVILTDLWSHMLPATGTTNLHRYLELWPTKTTDDDWKLSSVFWVIYLYIYIYIKMTQETIVSSLNFFEQIQLVPGFRDQEAYRQRSLATGIRQGCSCWQPKEPIRNG